MSRTINKFKVWNTALKCLVDSTAIALRADGTLVWVHEKEWHLVAPHYEPVWFTGLLDKNGKEIYEGDVAKITFTESSERWTELGIMCWVGKSAQFRFEIDGDELTREVSDPFIVIEVIGNIYENPELAK